VTEIETNNKEAKSQEKEEVPQELLDKALSLLKDVAKGNGLSPNHFSLKEFEGEVLNFETYAYFKIDPRISDKKMNGKQRANEIAGSEQDMRYRIRGEIEKISQNPKVKAYTVEMLNKRKDLGFFVDNHGIQLETLNKSYGVHEVCTTCSGSSKIHCQKCHGNGEVPCNRCNGSREMICHVCSGQQWLTNQNGERNPCYHCNGSGKEGCSACSQMGKTECFACKGSGKAPCKPCGGTGWNSHIAHMSVHAHSHFEYDKEDLPEELPEILEDLGPKLILEEHVEVKLEVDTEEEHDKEKELDQKARKEQYVIPYFVRLPWGDISFSYKDEEVFEGNLFGFQPSLLNMPPFLEKSTMVGLRSLKEAAEAPGNVRAKIQESLKFRIIAETFLTSARFGNKKAYRILCKKYPFGIRSNVLMQAIKQADTALKRVTLKPRINGLVIGLVMTALLYSFYYLGPIRELITEKAGAPTQQMLIDLTMLILGGTITTFAIQLTAVKALRETIGKIIPPKQQESLLPKAGKSAIWGYAAGILIYLLIVYFSIQMGKPAPDWIDEIKKTVL
jgi:hypothetical protein